MAESTKRKWQGSETCDICGTNLRDDPRRWFVDGITSGAHWAVMCSSCYDIHGSGLGTGRGQRYDSTTFEKVEG